MLSDSGPGRNAPPPALAVELKGLTKIYGRGGRGKGLVALDGVDDLQPLSTALADSC